MPHTKTGVHAGAASAEARSRRILIICAANTARSIMAEHMLRRELYARGADGAIEIRSAGALRDETGKRTGMMMIFEAADRSTAEALAANSPFLRAGLYDEHYLLEYQNEVG